MRRRVFTILFLLPPLLAPAPLRAHCDPSRIRAEINRAREAREDFVMFADIDRREGVAEICRYISRLAAARVDAARTDCDEEARGLLADAARLSRDAEHTRDLYARRGRKRPGYEAAACAP